MLTPRSQVGFARDVCILRSRLLRKVYFGPFIRASYQLHMSAAASMNSRSSSTKANKPIPVSRPSASILLISPCNEILLLSRVKSSSSFPSAHVFPGGNLSLNQDGQIPDVDDIDRHEDGEVYRLGAVRECFEESGILLARRCDDSDTLLELGDQELEDGRHAVHTNSVNFKDWLTARGGVPDTGSLIPFTRWITPANIPKRFTTQMYLYFLPLPHQAISNITGALSSRKGAVIPNPTSDGGIEHTSARFLPLTECLSMSRSGEIILFPPQLFLLHLLVSFLSPLEGLDGIDAGKLSKQREMVLDFVRSGDPSWMEKCISPTALLWKRSDGRAVLALDKPGAELNGSSRKGDTERVILVNFRKEGPRDVEVAWKKDIFEAERQAKGKL